MAIISTSMLLMEEHHRDRSDDLRSFVEVVESGGFNRAARRLGVSKSIVSRRIARLEAAVGTRLLSRTTRGISPTEAGLEFRRAPSGPCRAREAREAAPSSPAAWSVASACRRRCRLASAMCRPCWRNRAAPSPAGAGHLLSDRLVDLIANGSMRDPHRDLKDSSLVARRIAPVRSVLVAGPDYLAPKRAATQPRRPRLAWFPNLYRSHVADRNSGRASARSRSARRGVSGPERQRHPAVGHRGARHRRRPLVPLVSDAIASGTLEPLLFDVRLLGMAFTSSGRRRLCSRQERVPIDTLVERLGRAPLGSLPDERAWPRAPGVGGRIAGACRYTRARPTLRSIEAREAAMSSSGPAGIAG